MTTVNAMQLRVQDYLDERRRLGHALGIAGSRLLTFARFADDAGHKGPLTLQLIVDWAQGQATRATPITWARRLEIIRPFAKFCAQDDPGTAIPSADLFGRGHRRLTPHIYTDDEVAELLLAAGKLPPAGSLRPVTYQTLFGLIAATGLRLSEALNLRCIDFDSAQSRLTIRKTKFRKSRHVPLHLTAAAALAQYRQQRDHRFGSAATDHFFVTRLGTSLAKSTVHGVFQQLRTALGWIARGDHAAPRIHDLRHTFICKRVKLWQRDGADIDHAMIALATYVGHAGVAHTYWYLTGVPDLMAAAGDRFERYASETKEAGDA
ncbi:MAG: tyrosine-type recombinase/integrase [Rhodoplanes sp.]